MTSIGAEAMKKIAVLLVEGQHGVLSDMVRDVLQHASGVDLVGDITDIGETVDAVARTDCDAVVWVVPEAAAAVAPADLLRHHPRLRILGVEAHGTEGSLWRMCPHRTRLDTLSPEGIVDELCREP
jgi:DNA-binding NarL/FixJ family response regulator